MNKVIAALLSLIFSSLSISAVNNDMTLNNNVDSLEISLITCYPGTEIYELYGHEAIRAKSATDDVIFNYGLFNFDEPNFIYRFVKGETDYFAGATPTEYFINQYKRRNSTIMEQSLNLTQEESKLLYDRLLDDIKPENRVYRYNYIKNNCATRILDQIEYVIAKESNCSIQYQNFAPDLTTYRQIMRHYNINYPWYQLGIDLVLGPGIDYDVTPREKMFVPMLLMPIADFARISDGRKLIKTTHELYHGNEEEKVNSNSSVISPLIVMWGVFLMIMMILVMAYKRHWSLKWLVAIWYAFCGIAGMLIAFLVFVSVHEATSPNVFVWWLNPICLIVPLLIWMKKTEKIVVVYLILNTALLIGLMIGIAFGRQYLNPAIIPLILNTILISAYYCITYCKKNRYIRIQHNKQTK